MVTVDHVVRMLRIDVLRDSVAIRNEKRNNATSELSKKLRITEAHGLDVESGSRCDPRQAPSSELAQGQDQSSLMGQKKTVIIQQSVRPRSLFEH